MPRVVAAMAAINTLGRGADDAVAVVVLDTQ
jgi:hypothetical protein